MFMKYICNAIKSALLFILLMGIANNVQAQIPACSTYVFTTSSEPFTYLTGASSASTIHCDDCTMRFISVGFSFPFCGNNYSSVSACSNGFLSLSNSSSASLSNVLSGVNSIAPILQVMWDDMYGAIGSTASYKTQGTSPNRVFIFEWKNWRTYANRNTGAAISIQLKLYETSGRIQMHYKREASASSYNPGSASIGIAYSNADYQSLPNAGVSPVPSSTTFTTGINAWPATNQIYQWDPPTPCTKSSAFTMGNYNSQAASFSWTGVPGALDYQYAVDTRADLSPNLTTPITNTTVTSGSVTGLTPNTRYYLHVRTRCSLTSISQWDTLSFITLPACSRPDTLIVGYIDSNSVNFQWTPVTTALSYDYIVSQTKLTPIKALATNIISPTVALNNLTEGTVYYVYYRSLCTNADSSAWMLDSFRTPVPCRAPELSLSMLANNNAVVSWKLVNTAYQYEYYLGKEPTPPALGTPIKTNSVQTPYLVPSTMYDLFVRCNCNDHGILTNSKWSMLEFVTLPPTSISGVSLNTVFISAYPNPATETLNIAISGQYSSDAMLFITDIAGKQLQVVNVLSGKTSIDISKLTPGVYLLKYADGANSKVLRFNKM